MIIGTSKLPLSETHSKSWWMVPSTCFLPHIWQVKRSLWSKSTTPTSCAYTWPFGNVEHHHHHHYRKQLCGRHHHHHHYCSHGFHHHRHLDQQHHHHHDAHLRRVDLNSTPGLSLMGWTVRPLGVGSIWGSCVNNLHFNVIYWLVRSRANLSEQRNVAQLWTKQTAAIIAWACQSKIVYRYF